MFTPLIIGGRDSSLRFTELTERPKSHPVVFSGRYRPNLTENVRICLGSERNKGICLSQTYTGVPDACVCTHMHVFCTIRKGKFDIGHCAIKVKITTGLRTFSPLTIIQTARSYNSTLVQSKADIKHVC